jgi:hypothetical protein
MIHTTRALQVIEEWLLNSYPSSSKHQMFPALMTSLRIVMTLNIIPFGDTFWVPLTGTGRGTSTFGTQLCRALFLHFYTTNSIRLYGRLADDGVGTGFQTC